MFVNDDSLGEEFLGVIISESKVQPYKCSSDGFVPDGESIAIGGIKIGQLIGPTDYFYVWKGSTMYLKLKV